jgi:hypothetical protein
VRRRIEPGLEAVLPTGEAIRAGVQTRKGVVGYDLAHLLVGSEGTLGVIIKLFLKGKFPLLPVLSRERGDQENF